MGQGVCVPGQLAEVSSLLHHVGPRDETVVASRDSEYFYQPPSCWPSFTFS